MPFKDKAKQRESWLRSQRAARDRVPEITREMFMESASYDPDTGVFIRTRSLFAANVGKQMGKIGAYGHRQIRLFGRTYMAHRLAWGLRGMASRHARSH